MTEPTPKHAPGARELPRLALRAPEAAQALGIGRRLLWSLSVSGEIPSCKVGGARLYPVALLEAYLRQQAEGGGQ